METVKHVTYYKLLVFSRTPILFLTTYFMPVFFYYYFGRSSTSQRIGDLSFSEYYLPLYIQIGMMAISIFTVGVDLVKKRESKMYKRLELTQFSLIKQFFCDVLFSLFLSIPLIVLLLIESQLISDFNLTLYNLFFLVPLLICCVMNTSIVYFVFRMIDDVKISSPLQLSLFGFTLFSLGILFPYSMMSPSVTQFLRFTPFYYSNRLSEIFWNSKYTLTKGGNNFFEEIVSSLSIIIGISILAYVLSMLIERIISHLE